MIPYFTIGPYVLVYSGVVLAGTMVVDFLDACATLFVPWETP